MKLPLNSLLKVRVHMLLINFRLTISVIITFVSKNAFDIQTSRQTIVFTQPTKRAIEVGFGNCKYSQKYLHRVNDKSILAFIFMEGNYKTQFEGCTC